MPDQKSINPAKCPTCESPRPSLHPAMQFEGEVQPCRDPWHGPLPGYAIAPERPDSDYMALGDLVERLNGLCGTPPDDLDVDLARMAARITIEHVWMHVRGHSPTLPQLELWLDKLQRRVQA